MLRVSVAISLCTLVFWIAGCGLEEPGTFDPNLLQSPYRAGAQNDQTEPLRPLPTGREPAYPSDVTAAEAATQPAPTTGPSLGSESTITLSLQDIIHRAIVNNHDIRAAGYQPAIDAARVVEAEAHFDPELFSDVDWEHKHEPDAGELFTDPITQALIRSNFTASDTMTTDIGIKQTTPSGTQLQLDDKDSFNYNYPRLYTLDPFFENQLTLQVTQPLLKDFGVEVNEARTVIARDNQKISTLDFRKQIEDTLDKIEKAYWQLVQSQADVKYQEQLLDITQQTWNVLYQRFLNHVDVTDLELAQAQTSLELRRTTLIDAKQRARSFSDTLRQLMADPSLPVSKDILIIPADKPTTEPIEFNVQEQIDSALDNRLELTEQLDKIDIAAVTAKVAENNLLPELDFVGQVGSEGLGANEGDAIGRQAIFRDVDYGLGIKFDYFLGNREARAIWKRTLLARMQAIETYRGAIDQVTADVMTASRQITSAWEQMVSTRLARDQAQKALDAYQARQDSGVPLTPEFVNTKLDIQDRLASAEQEEDRATASYNIAIEQLEKAKGTLLRYNNVLLEENPNLFTGKDYLH
jgi:outer membrane protein TolC